MPTSIDTTAPSKSRLLTGRILSTLTVLFLIMDIAFKFIALFLRRCCSPWPAWI